MKSKQITRAYGYIRVSGPGQIEGHGLQRQRDAIEAYVNTHGIELVEIFADAGVSGTNDLADRPALGQLMISIEGADVSAVVIEKLDRLARDLIVQEAILADLRQQGVRLISVAEGEDLASDDPTRTLVRQIMGAVAMYEKTMLVLKLRAAREAQRKAKGKCEGAKAYGEVDPTERRAVEPIRQLRRKRPGKRRLGPRRIARIMERECHPTRFGGQWTEQTVKAILAGPVYKKLRKRKQK
jgi:DNA invertase Pin-like site-specific DNA recombinase